MLGQGELLCGLVVLRRWGLVGRGELRACGTWLVASRGSSYEPRATSHKPLAFTPDRLERRQELGGGAAVRLRDLFAAGARRPALEVVIKGAGQLEAQLVPPLRPPGFGDYSRRVLTAENAPQQRPHARHGAVRIVAGRPR